jgi:endoglucanase
MTFKRCGFNFLWAFICPETGALPKPADERALDFIADQGFDFVRVPSDYRYWTKDHAYTRPDESVLALFDGYLEACRSRSLHMSLNLHRAPGYCINRNDLEVHSLWTDAQAQEGFVFLWTWFARRFKGVPADQLSFDLVNEPPSVGQYGLTRENHAAIMRRVKVAIHAVDPQRPVIIDGLGGGHLPMPELAGEGFIHSGRGYQPFPVSHWGAHWFDGWRAGSGPHYPHTAWDGQIWDKEVLRAFYQPWRDVEAKGNAVHIGEFGCYNQTPNADALRWFRDLLSLYREFGWGYALWNFEGPFGVASHGRSGARYESMGGFEVDRELLELLRENRPGV